MKSIRCHAIAAAAFCLLSLGAATAVAAVPADDRFIAGYVAAILEREFGLTDTIVRVESGIVTIEPGSLEGHSRNRIEAALATIPGVEAVRFTAPEEAAPVTREKPAETAPPVTVEADRDGIQILPRGTLFESLQADPRWPHFSAAYRYHDNDRNAEHVGAVSFGETLSLVRGPGLGGQWELEFQAGVFSIFDLHSESEDLINADYVVGIPLAYRRGDFSGFLSVYHQSSHLGDEFLLRDDVNPEDRINLSYEAARLMLSYDVGEPWRVYGGGAYLFDREPDSLERGMAQAGIEYESETVYWNMLRPVAALDVQFWQHQDWSPDFSLRAGFEIGDPGILGQQLELTAEYYDGRNPNGQFFSSDLEYFGLGLHLYFN